MSDALTQFNTNIQAIRDIKNTVDHIDRITTKAIDVSDLYRSQIVLTVSALDYFIHEHTLNEMISIYNAHKPTTQAFLNFQTPLSIIFNATTKPADIIVKDAIKAKHSWLSFQDPDKIGEAIRLISEKKIWEDIGLAMNISAKDLKTRLKLIVDRRNKIAHEADMNPTYPGTKWSITHNDVNDTINFIYKFVNELYKITI